MRGWRVAVAVAAVVLAVPPLTTTTRPAPAHATPRTAGAPAVPCPKATPPSPPARPPRPAPPPSDPAQREVGGAALATAELAAPEGARRPPAITATSWLVADLDSGEVLGACGAHEYGVPASVQKLLLAATVLPKLNPKQVITVTRADLNIEPGSSAVGLLDGGRYSVETLWLGLLLNSGNDAANVLARLGGGTDGVPGTVRAMNAEARRLGAYQTRAVTPSGLDGPGQFTSAYDLALIARACFANPTFRRYTLTERTQIPAQPAKKKGGFQIQNENQLVFRYPGALGGKTGFTDLARHTYVGAAARDGRRLVATLLGAEARPLRGWQQGAALLDWGFALPRDASVGRLVEPAGAGAPGAPPARDEAAPAEAPKPQAERRAAAASDAGPRTWVWIAVGVGAFLVAAPLLLRARAVRRRAIRRSNPAALRRRAAAVRRAGTARRGYHSG